MKHAFVLMIPEESDCFYLFDIFCASCSGIHDWQICWTTYEVDADIDCS